MHANLEVTNLCNQQCVYCFNDSGPYKKSHTKLVDWLDVIPFLGKVGFRSVHFTGGEPFLLSNILQLMSTALHHGQEISVLSNGYRVSDILADARTRPILQKLSVAQISLDSMDAAKHDRRRRKNGAWTVATSAITALRKYGIPIEISCVVDAQNADGVVTLAQFAEVVKAKLIVRPRVSLGRARQQSGGFNYVLPDWLKSQLESFKSVLTDDRFCYVPSDVMPNKNSASDTITILPSGKIRGGLGSIFGVSSTLQHVDDLSVPGT